MVRSFPENFDMLDARAGWPATAPRNQRLNGAARTFGDGRNGAVIAVHHPAGEPELPGLARHGSAIVHALNPAADFQDRPRRLIRFFGEHVEFLPRGRARDKRGQRAW